MSEQNVVFLYVHCCHVCGKEVTSEPQTLKTIDKITILCEDCSSGFKNRLKKVCQKALDHWGLEAQIDMVIEECSELIIALLHYKRRRDIHPSEVIGEAIDVELMLAQLRLIFDKIGVWDGMKEAAIDRLEKTLSDEMEISQHE